MTQIIIGTSSWGSKINFKKSLIVGNKLISMGLNYFDTAPNYGSGYSHYILNYLGKRNDIKIDTKYGQNINLSIKEILKRIYRFKNYESFKQSLKYIKFKNQNRSNKKFWHIKKINSFVNNMLNDLNFCKIKTIYLHTPPYGILNELYLKNFCNLLKEKKIIAGISDPDERDLEIITKKFPSIKIQLSLNYLYKQKFKLNRKINEININSIFKTFNENNINKESNNYYLKNFKKFLKKNKKFNLVLGINSFNSVRKLPNIIKEFIPNHQK